MAASSKLIVEHLDVIEYVRSGEITGFIDSFLNAFLFQAAEEGFSNCIDGDEFFPIEKSAARVALGISSDKPIVLIGATSIHAPYKGLELFMESMALFPEDKYLVLVFGKCQQGWSVGLKQEIKELGYLADSTSLRLAYSAADVFVAPSKMEAFGKTLVEAMACQTPTVCFNACGPRDIVDHKITGYKARAFDSSDLARGIDWVIGANVDGALGKAAESAASKCFEKSVIAKRYVALYENLLEQ